MRAGRVVRGVAANLFDKLAITGMQLLLVPVLTLHWGLAIYGGWVMLSTIPSFLAVSDFGFAGAAGTQMTMLVARDEREEALRVFQSAWVVVLVSSAAMFLAVAVISYALPNAALPVTAGFSAGDARLTLFLLMVYGLVGLQSSIFMAAFRAAGLFPFGTLAIAMMILAENTAVVFVVWFGGAPLSAAVALLTVRLLGVLGQAVALHRKVPWMPIGFRSARRDMAKELVGPALAIMMVPLSQAAVLQGTALMVGLACTQSAVPIFTAVRTLSRVGLQFTQLLNHALMPEYSAAVGRGDSRSQAVMVLLTVAAAAAVLVPFALVLAIWGKPIVGFWTRGAIMPGEGLLIAMAASVVLGGIWNPLSNLILAMNRHASYSYPYVLGAAIIMPVTYELSVKFGVAGGGIAMALLDLGMCVVVLRLCRLLLPGLADLGTAASDIVSQRHRYAGRMRAFVGLGKS